MSVLDEVATRAKNVMGQKVPAGNLNTVHMHREADNAWSL